MTISMPNEELQESLDSLNKRGWYASDRIPARGVKTKDRDLKLKFKCDCKHSWSTMKGLSSFKLWKDGGDKNIFCELFTQQCKRCDEFCQPEVYNDQFDSIVDSVTYAYDHPGKKKGIRKKAGNPRKSHDSKRCEACYSGKCSLANRGDEDEGEE
eukprot:TRINITY_DN1358_c0_g2_i2.p1 TRINITY_DN1358_c0_g2~~TRINITY_DN1358_c0_g2_i2.p1  ORF type:complete len:155 (-),score=21.62 TRINITY_DN1358_c0_g2_i2:872-1336(-)